MQLLTVHELDEIASEVLDKSMTYQEYTEGELQAMRHRLGFCTIDVLDPPLEIDPKELVVRDLDMDVGVKKIVESMKREGVHNRTLVTAFRGVYLGKGVDVSKLALDWTEENLPSLVIIETDDYIMILIAGGQHRIAAARIYGKELIARVEKINELVDAKVAEGVERSDLELRNLLQERHECEADLYKLRHWLMVWVDYGKQTHNFDYTRRC